MSIFSLNCRLLCACEVAEEVLPGKPFSPDPRYLNPIGYHNPPIIIKGGVDEIDVATLGTNDDGVILAFRGTLPPAPNVPAILDWLQDLLAVTVEVEGLPGRVHMGFYDAIQTIWKPLLAAVTAQVTSGKVLIITGHSKGAAVATIAAYMLHNAGITAAKVIPFASPNPGDVDFAAGFQKIFSQTRYTNYMDIVPFLPPTPALAKRFEDLPEIGWLFKDFAKWNYAAVGNGIFVQENGSILNQAADPTAYAAAIGADLITIGKVAETLAGLSEIGNAHSLMCGHGYMKGVCQNAVCGKQ